jgi:hypothetical protein
VKRRQERGTLVAPRQVRTRFRAARSPWNISPTFSSKKTRTEAVRSPDLMGDHRESCVVALQLRFYRREAIHLRPRQREIASTTRPARSHPGRGLDAPATHARRLDGPEFRGPQSSGAGACCRQRRTAADGESYRSRLCEARRRIGSRAPPEPQWGKSGLSTNSAVIRAS